MMSYARPTAPILIVGAGPTGLTLAHELLRHGVKPRLIERSLAVSPKPKALGVMARTLELLAPSGVTNDMLARGVQVPTFSVWSSGRQLASLDFTEGVESPYSFILMLPQRTTEAILTDHIIRQGGRVERGVELVSLTQQAESVEVVLRHPDRTEERACSSFLIGCDGAHSTVRHGLGVPFVGKTVAQRFVTGIVRMHWNFPDNQALAFLNRGHLIAFFPWPDGQHQFLSASPQGQTPEGEVTPEEIQRVIEDSGPVGAWATDLSWLARYQVHRRKVDCYLHQRVLLAGDAAHIHSPLGAQGMNAGMQDAMNLAWKLSLVAKGRAPERLLESYQIERAEIGTRLLREDAVLTRLAFVHHPLAIATRDGVASSLTQHTQVQRYLTSTAGGLRTSYHHGPLVFDYCGEKVKSAAPAVNVGGRALDGPLMTSRRAAPIQLVDLLRGTSHALLIFMLRQDNERTREIRSVLVDWQDLLEVFPIRRFDSDDAGEPMWHDPDGTLAARYGIADEGLVLIRPDGYISFRSRPIAAEPLQRFLRAHFTFQHA